MSQSALSLGPGFTNVMQAGPNLILQGTNGPPEGAFSVLRSANLMQPLDNWLLAGLDNFDSNGNFSFTNPLPAIPASFYTLRVLSAVAVPDIIGQPGDELVFPGQTATFTVVADGAPPLHYQWYYNVPGNGLTSG